MELAHNFKRFIFVTVAISLLAAFPGCNQKPTKTTTPPPLKNKSAGDEGEKKVNTPSPIPSDDTGAKAAKPAKETGDGELPPLVAPNSVSEPPSSPMNPGLETKAAINAKSETEAKQIENAKPNSDAKEKVTENAKSGSEVKSGVENAKPDIKEDKNGKEKPMTDEEIAAANAQRRQAALKEVIDKLGPPLVENIDKLTRAHPLYPVWIDKQKKRVILEGSICQTNAPLEMFAVPTGTKEHEAIVSVPTEAYVVHAALLAVGAKPGKPVEFGPKPSDYKPATGTEIDITVKWKNEKGEIQTARAQDWIKNVKTGKSMKEPWVFGGSGFWKDEQTGIEYYKAEGGDFICVSNFPSAMLDLPIESSQSNDELMFQANRDRIPPLNTPVTLILTPKN